MAALLGCAPVTRVGLPPAAPPPSVPPPAALPAFQKTFGEAVIGIGAAIAIRYKSLTLNIDTDADGFPQIKGAKPGHRTMLKSGEDFVFVTAVQNPQAHSKRPVIAYVLEFDNGRNLFIAGDVSKSDELRELTYNLRDDGKEIYAGFFTRRNGTDEQLLAQMIGLIQPKNALIARTDAAGSAPINEAALSAALKTELFDGPVVLLSPGRSIPF